MRALLLVICLLSTEHVTCQYCPQGTCYAGSLSKDHVTEGRYLWGASYRNLSSVAGPQTCHSACVGDCRCRAFQISGKRCELLAEDKDSLPSTRFLHEASYHYYDLKQRIVKNSHFSPCRNGCCMSELCRNGGTCTEHCEDPKKKFSCTCPSTCTGKRCEKCGIYKSCRDHLIAYRQLGQEISDGVYKIQTGYLIFPVYCVFEATRVWTLLESFAFEYKLDFAKKTFLEADNTMFNEDTPNWIRYRLSHSRMSHVRIDATMFKATCAYDQKTTISGWPRDQLIARLSEYDVMTPGVYGQCVNVESVIIRNQSCSGCTVGIYQAQNSVHICLDTTHHSCSFNPTGAVESEDSFGFYGFTNPESTCCSSQEATTQWWLGHELTNAKVSPADLG
ncbi:uncharacterized protein LOC116614147 [Nematostella vectensis]|uniref:uncharacterized protein LOC116614147 n=1 Tax=Nematostella vectensis TaxID=45351 RepID=UPI001390538E|nr:uncharacterized protein LOC116614147 [Nematostella vectensis]